MTLPDFLILFNWLPLPMQPDFHKSRVTLSASQMKAFTPPQPYHNIL
jgi:hypothetical protein